VSLEQFQARHNSHISATGNSSASNDPAQQPHDANELLIRGAGMAAAGKELGLSEEETLSAVSRQYRRQNQRAAYRDRNKRQAEWSQKQASLGEWGDGEVRGVGFGDYDDEAFAFGEDPNYNEFDESGKPVRRDKRGTQADDNQPYNEGDKGYTIDEETGLLRRETYEETRGEPVTMAPKSAMQDALAQLTAGTEQFGYDAFPGSADVAGRLEAQISQDTGADKALGAETVRRDNQRFSPEMRAENDEAAGYMADAIARDGYTVNGSGAMADEAIGRISELRKIGPVMFAGKGTGEDPRGVVQYLADGAEPVRNAATQRADGVYLDPATGDPLAIQGPATPGMPGADGSPNNGSSSNALNAPQSAREWAASTMPEYKEGAAFNTYPQVDITLETTNLATKVKEFGVKNGIPQLASVSPNIRSIDELQKLVSFVSQRSAGLTIPDPENPRRSLPAGRLQAAGVMNALGVTPFEQQRLANAMLQLDAQARSSVNMNQTGTYLSRTGEAAPREDGLTRDRYPQVSTATAESLIANQRRQRGGEVAFDAKEAINNKEGQAKLARIPRGSMIGARNEDGDVKRQSIVALMKQLPSTDAAVNAIGQVQGEKPRVNRFRGGGLGEGDEMRSNLRRQAESRAKGGVVDEQALKANQVKASLVEEREKRDNRRRAEQADEVISRIPPNARQVRLPRRG
jgi:hypothetical protein